MEGTAAAKTGGLKIPVLWNSSAYELPETLDMLSDTVDVFLPDMKTLDSGVSGKFFNAPDYPGVAAAAIKKMLEMRPLRYRNGRLVSGVMVRHLVLPGYLEASREVLRWFAGNCAGKALFSLMFQFTPINSSGEEPSLTITRSAEYTGFVLPDSAPQRYISQAEYGTVIGWLGEFGIEDGYCQELVPGNTDWLPDFEKENPFPSDLSVPVWHWRHGWI
jgi:putative pyruvate formate lyase activating enzyme